MQTVTFEQLMTFVIVVGALIGAYNLLTSFAKNRRENRAVHDAPVEELKRQQTEQLAMLDRDKKRLEKMDEILEAQQAQIDRLDDGINLLMRANLEMIRHERHGNNVDGLETAEREILKHLTDTRRNEHD